LTYEDMIFFITSTSKNFKNILPSSVPEFHSFEINTNIFDLKNIYAYDIFKKVKRSSDPLWNR
jgi:hypothetical protein